MSLNWSISDIADWQKVAMREENGAEGSKTEALIFATMSVGLPGITKKNVDEFFDRIGLLEKLRGAFINHYVEDGSMPGGLRQVPYYFTREDIVRRVGLHTNVSSETRAKFLKRVTKRAA